jgi:hypothetical protein
MRRKRRDNIKITVNNRREKSGRREIHYMFEVTQFYHFLDKVLKHFLLRGCSKINKCCLHLIK